MIYQLKQLTTMANLKRITFAALLLAILVMLSLWTQAQENMVEGNVSEAVMAAHDFGINFFNTLETEGIENFVSEDWVLHDPANSGYTGVDGFTTWAMSFHALMPDFEVVHLDPLVGSDEYLVYRWEFTGTHTGEVPEIMPTGNEIHMTGIVFHHIVDGQFVETWLSYDNMALLTQLGLLPAATE